MACGKRGDPLPPLPRAPQPVTSLKLAQRGDKLEIAYVAPRATTGGVRLGVLDIEILRADAAGDFMKTARRDRRRAAPGESLAETVPLPPAGTAVRVAARALDGGHPSSLSSVATLTVLPPPPAPHDLVAELSGDLVSLRWEGTVPSPPPTPVPPPAPSPAPGTVSPALAPGVTAPVSPPGTASPAPPPPGIASPAPPPAAAPAPPPAAPATGASPAPSPAATPRPPSRGFFVYRRADPSGTYREPLRPEPLATNTFEDHGVALGQKLCYVVATAISTEPVIESMRSNEACLAVRDIVPPASPSGVTTLPGPGGVEISWTPSSEADLASYRVFRQAPGGPREKIGEVAPGESSLRDTTAAPGIRYAYTVTAVDRAGNESPPSAPVAGGRP